MSRNLVAALAQQLSGRILFEADHVTYTAWETLRAGELELVPTTGLTLGLRAVKEPEELDAIRRAAAITDRAYERLAGQPFTGRTERDLAWTMEQLLHEEGAEALAFPIIVASGPNAANPHTVPGDRRVQRGDTVDRRRRCALRRLLLRLHADVRRRRALRSARGRVPARPRRAARRPAGGRPGIEAKAADAAPRRLIDDSEFEGTFGHGLGHGVGLEIHEAPTMRRESHDRLATGNVVSVEPGIYLPDEGGVRIEDLVIVTDDGCERLSLFPKELRQVG